MALVLFTSERITEHLTPPGHPERPERAEEMLALAAGLRATGRDVREPAPASDEALLRVHQATYLEYLRSTAGRAVALDPDTVTSPQSFEVARLAAGAALAAVDAALDGAAGTRALALVRPPGHHAEADHAMGFCLLNNIAIAAAHARTRGVERVAIVDYDVHHGNGTQRTFYADPSVLFISTHQFPYYPGTGAAREVGVDAGRGFTVNLPLEAGAGDADYEQVFRQVVLPVLRQFKPGLILISAGFDAHADDPLGGMRVSSAQFGRLTAMLVAVANESCGGRVVAVTEGGYDLPALGASLRAVVAALERESGSPDDEHAAGLSAAGARRGEEAIRALRPWLAGAWTL